MKNKRLFGFCLLSLTAIIAITTVSLSNHNLLPFGNADSTKFELVMNKDKNKFHNTEGSTPMSGTTTVKTELRNKISYTYSNIIGGGTSTWHVLSSSDSYFYNTDALNGLDSITLSFKTDNKQFKVYWSDTITFTETNSETYTSSNVNETVCNFNGFDPNFVKVINLSNDNLDIYSVSYSYSCVNQYYELTRTSEDTNKGTVSGSSGVIKAGTNVTITATPNAGYSFKGWYKNSELVSSDSSYAFFMPYNDVTLVAKWINEGTISLTSPSNNAVIDIRNERMKDFIEHYSQAYSAKYYDGKESCVNNSINLSWSTSTSFKSYVVRISTDPNFSSFKTYLTLEKSFTFDNPMTNTTYYWQVTGYDNDSTVSSGIYCFNVDIAPRFITADGISNMRDIGGYSTSDGKYVKQGIFYRSATLDNVTQKGISTTTVDLKIKTELDLNGNSTHTSSPLGENVKYIKYACPWWLEASSNGIDNPANAPAIKNIVEVFADSSNYPLDFHCSLGQDRTGTIAILVLGLLGVSERDILMDYEYTQMSAAGYAASIPVVNKFTYQVNPTMNYLKTFNSNGSDFKNCVITYLKSFVSVSQSTIDSIQANLLEA